MLSTLIVAGNVNPLMSSELDHRSELNLGVERSGFTLVRFCKENPELDLLVKVSRQLCVLFSFSHFTRLGSGLVVCSLLSFII